MPDETLRSELNDAKDHAREAARATLLAMRSALDFAINKLGLDEEPAAATPPPAQASAPAPGGQDEPTGSGS